MDNNKTGRKTWIFPDAELPPPGDSLMKGHESLIILNLNKEKAKIEITLYFSDDDPVKLSEISVEPERVKCIRLDNSEEIGYSIPLETQYAVKVESTVPVVAQYGRLDARQNNLAYYTTMGFTI